MKNIQNKICRKEELKELFEDVDILMNIINPKIVKIKFEELKDNKYMTKIYVGSKDFKKRYSG